jgi:polar amino acid transport system substrate-binding protein
MATSPDFAPMEFIDLSKTGQDSYVGSDIELGKYIADKLGVELVIEAMDFSACQAAVTSGNVDISISGFAKTEERAENMALSEFYNVEDRDGKGQGILVLKENADKYKIASDFSGKVVAAQNGSLQNQLATTQLPEDVKFESITNLNDGVMMLVTGKVDAIAVSSDNGEAFANNYGEIVMSDFYFDYIGEGNVVAVTKGEDELLNEINKIIKEVNEKGLYQQWKTESISLANELGVDMD